MAADESENVDSGSKRRVAAHLEPGTSGVPIAPEIHRATCGRLAWVAICYSLGYAIAFGYYWIQVFAHHAPRPDLLSNVVAVAAIGLGVVVYVRTKRCIPSPGERCRSLAARAPAIAYAKLASVFEIAAALGIIVGWGWGWEHDMEANLVATGVALGIPPESLQSELVDRLVSGNTHFFEFLGVSWVGVWIVFFPLLVPGEPRRIAWASVLAASTVPAVLLGSILVNGVPAPVRPWVPQYLGNLIVPTYICAAFAIIGSRVVYKLTHELSVARRMGSYELVEKLGAGGMGEVWRAKHRMLARPGAIKIIRPETLGAEEGEQATIVKKRFEQEAQATALLRSPHTIDLYDFGVTAEGDFFYVMELLDGIDLRTLVEKHGPVPIPRTAYLLRQICHSLEEAHARGLVHRDIKPANVFVCRQGLEYDFAKVLDFGLVRRAHGSPDGMQLTAVGIAQGTPTFMSPELALGRPELDGRTDLYALGCVAYWLVTGQLVFEGETPIAVIARHVQESPVPPSQRSELEIPPDFDRLILECLAKDPAKRPQTAKELSRRLGQCARGAGTWTQEQAEHWWSLHAPATAASLPATPLTGQSRTVGVPRAELHPH